jgi:hypothetical protein
MVPHHLFTQQSVASTSRAALIEEYYKASLHIQNDVPAVPWDRQSKIIGPSVWRLQNPDDFSRNLSHHVILDVAENRH